MYRKDISVTLSLLPFVLRNHLETAVGPNLSRISVLGIQREASVGSVCNYPDDIIRQIRSPTVTNTCIYFHIFLSRDRKNRAWIKHGREHSHVPVTVFTVSRMFDWQYIANRSIKARLLASAECKWEQCDATPREHFTESYKTRCKWPDGNTAS